MTSLILSIERRSFAAQDVLVPWHLGDHHAQDKKKITEGSGHLSDDIINNIDVQLSQIEVSETGLSGCGDGHLLRQYPKEGGKAVAPTPRAPRHGIRREPAPGSEGSVVYQRYCHVYVEGELEGLVEKVDGLKLLESYYDRSNWCVVAEREMDIS